jgi:hypothetical protein
MSTKGKKFDKLTSEDKQLKFINAKFEGRFFGYVFEKRVSNASVKNKTSQIILPAGFAGKRYTVILIPKELNKKMIEMGQTVDIDSYMKKEVRDQDYFKKRLPPDNKPTELSIIDEEVRL